MPRLYVRELDKFDAKPLAGTEGAFQPFFSPDGTRLGFFTVDGLKTTSLREGSPTLIREARNALGATWAPDDTILFGQSLGKELVQVTARDGISLRVLTTQVTTAWPSLLPDGRGVLFGGRRPIQPIGFIALDPGSSPKLTEIPGTSAHYLASGHVVFAREGTLWGARLDLDRLEIVGAPVALLTGVRHEADSGAAQFAISRDGTLAYIPGEFLEQGELLWVYRDGRDPVPAWPGKKVYGEFAVSPGGDRLAIALRTGESDVWIYDFDRKVPTRLTFEGENRVPVWSSDGKQIYYRSYRNGKTVINRKPADGGGKEELLGDLLGEFVGRPRSVRGQVMLYTVGRRGDYDISALQLDTGQVESIVETRHLEVFPFLSPDGQRLAYCSSKTGRTEVYVCPFPDGTPPVPISSDGGEEPQWSADGKELFYRNQDKWLVVDMTGIKPGPPQLLFEGPYLNIPGMSYDYDATNERFLVLRGIEDKYPVTEIRVVLNWFEEVRELIDGEGE